MDQLIELAALGFVDDDELADIGLHHMMDEIPRQLRAERYGIFNLDGFDDNECRLQFRFQREHLDVLRNLLGIPDQVITANHHKVPGLEAFCILLRRLAYPNRLVDLEEKFGRAKSSLSSISNTVLDIVFANKSHLLHDLRNLNWLTEVRLRQYAAAVGAMCPVQNCWGFIDGTARPICRPSQRQEEYYSGHKRVHCVKYQSVVCPDGIIASMMGPYQGSRHDAGILRDTNLYEQLEIKTRFSEENKFVLYGDAAYPIRELLLKPYQTRALVPVEANFNYEMSRARQAVEWGFGKIISEFAFVDFKKNQKLLLQQIGKMYTVATLLTNCHTCLYQGQTSSYFDIQPPSIEEYLQ